PGSRRGQPAGLRGAGRRPLPVSRPRLRGARRRRGGARRAERRQRGLGGRVPGRAHRLSRHRGDQRRRARRAPRARARRRTARSRRRARGRRLGARPGARTPGRRGARMTALTVLFAFVLMLGPLIFIHELGHFLMAKLFDVKVLRFSLGFGPAIGIGRWRLAFRRGETEYVAAWFPLGGYVKMVGESPQDGEEAPPEERLEPGEEHRAFNRKPAWQRLLILFAGPAMNLLLPVLVFGAALALGMPRKDPVIGTVESASPAAQAGLAVGDRVLAVDGEPVRWWEDVEEAIRARAGETLTLRIERDGDTRDVELPVEARSGLDLYGSATEVGFAGIGHGRVAAVVGVVEAGAPATATELRPGDRVRQVDGEPVADWSEFAARYARAEGEARLTVDRLAAPGAEPESLEIRVPALGSVEALGVVPATVLIVQVAPDSPAQRAGLQAGDLLVALDGRPIGSFASFSEQVRASGGRPLQIVYARGGERRE